MKKLFFSVAALVLTTVTFAQHKSDEIAKFSTEIIDQGKIKQNNPEEVKFIVTNIGKEPLIIEQANPTCGCTIGDYTKTPIAPGATGYVSAKFNAAALNHFTKTLTVKFAGADDIKNITITGDVLSAEDYDKWKLENPTPATLTKVTPAANTVKPASAVVKPVKAAKVKKVAAVTAAPAVKS